jgi:hypothetical protein
VAASSSSSPSSADAVSSSSSQQKEKDKKDSVLSPSKLWQRLTKDKDKDKEQPKEKEKAAHNNADGPGKGDAEKAGGSPSRTRIKDWLRSKMNKDDDKSSAAASSSAASAAASPSSSPSSSIAAPVANSSGGGAAAAKSSPPLNPRASSPLQRHAPPARRHSHKLLPDDGSPAPPMSYSGKANINSALPPASSDRGARSHSRNGSSATAASTSPSHNFCTEAERALRAPTAPRPTPCTILLSTRALYVFPPAIAVDMDEDVLTGALVPAPAEHEKKKKQSGATASATAAEPATDAAETGQPQSANPPATVTRRITKYFMVYNEYVRVSLHDIGMVSLPYRSGLTRSGADLALRITDFAVHLAERINSQHGGGGAGGAGSVVSGLAMLSGSGSGQAALSDGPLHPFQTLWLQAPRNCRSLVVESLSDAVLNLRGLPLELAQPDYAELIADILSSSSSSSEQQSSSSSSSTAVATAGENRIATQVREAALATAWKAKHVVHSGYLHHRATHVWPAIVAAGGVNNGGAGGGEEAAVDFPDSSSPEPSPSPPAPALVSDPSVPRLRMRSRVASDWRSHYFVLTGPAPNDRFAPDERVLRPFASQQDMESWRYVCAALASGKTLPRSHQKHFASAPEGGDGVGLGLPMQQIDLKTLPASVVLREANALAGEGHAFSFELLVFPRTSSMREEEEEEAEEVNGGDGGEHDATRALPPLSAQAQASFAALQACLPPDVRDHPVVRASAEGVLEYGFARHLFEVPAPPPPGMSQSQAIAAAAAASAGSVPSATRATSASVSVASSSSSSAQTSLLSSANQRKQQAQQQQQQQQQLQGSAPSTPARSSSLSVSSISSSGTSPVLLSPGRSAAASTALMNADLRCWVRALRAAIAGGSVGMDVFAATPPVSPATSRVAGRGASASVSVSGSATRNTAASIDHSGHPTLAPPIFDPSAHRTPSPAPSPSPSPSALPNLHDESRSSSASHTSLQSLPPSATPSPTPNNTNHNDLPPVREDADVGAVAAAAGSDAPAAAKPVDQRLQFDDNDNGQDVAAAASDGAVAAGSDASDSAPSSDLFSFPADAAGAVSPLGIILPSSPSELP